jgi:multicomponent Na+:H+ antiporter subunit E
MLRIVTLLLVSVAIFEGIGRGSAALVAAAAAAALVTTRLPARAPVRLRPLRLLQELPWLAAHAARGGIDVALRSLQPRLALRPGFVEYGLRVRDPVARVIFANAVSLMPGTFTARLDGTRLLVHVLDERSEVLPHLARVEQRVARLFGEEIR